MRKTFSNHSILFLACAILSALGILMFMIYSTRVSIGETQTLFGQIKILENKTGTLYGGRAVLKNSAQALLTLDASLASQNDGKLFEALESFAKKAGVSLIVQSITNDSIEGKELKSLKLRLAFNGSWASVVGFARGLERFPFVLNFQGLALSANTNSDKKISEWNGVVDVTLPVIQ